MSTAPTEPRSPIGFGRTEAILGKEDTAMNSKPPGAETTGAAESTRTGLSADALQRAVLDNLVYMLARPPAVATPHDWYMALAYSVRDRMLERWVRTVETCAKGDVKIACYLS